MKKQMLILTLISAQALLQGVQVDFDGKKYELSAGPQREYDRLNGLLQRALRRGEGSPEYTKAQQALKDFFGALDPIESDEVLDYDKMFDGDTFEQSFVPELNISTKGILKQKAVFEEKIADTKAMLEVVEDKMEKKQIQAELIQLEGLFAALRDNAQHLLMSKHKEADQAQKSKNIRLFGAISAEVRELQDMLQHWASPVGDRVSRLLDSERSSYSGAVRPVSPVRKRSSSSSMPAAAVQAPYAPVDLGQEPGVRAPIAPKMMRLVGGDDDVSFEHDPEMRRALALSMQQQRQPMDEDDEDLQRALALSMGQQ